jgi:hypothetical protein
LSPAAVAASRSAAKDVKITSCSGDAKHHVVVKGTAHNSTKKRENYDVSVLITGKPGSSQYGTVASAQQVAPGATATFDAATTAPYAPGMTCKVTRVVRQ